MTKQNIRYIIVILLPPENGKQVEFIQKKYENDQWQIIMPAHVTVVRPGTAIQPLETTITQFQNLSLPTTPITVQASQIDTFLNGPNANVVYLKVSPNQALLDLHQYLLKLVCSFMEAKEDFGEFIPHVTLANNIESDSESDSVVNEVSGQDLQLDFIADQIHLYKKSDTDPKWVWLAAKHLS